MKFIFRPLLYIISFPVFSRIYGRLTKLKNPKFLIKKIIRGFIKTYSINMDEYEGNIEDYDSLADIFIRKLDPAKRVLKPDSGCILSPADGIVSSIEFVKRDKAIQVKGVEYNISEFLNNETDFSDGWYITTIYLSPSNYHRYHFPVEGIVKGYCHMRGHLYPVNSLGLNNIKGLFIKNERIVLKMDTKDTEIYIAAVGATFVGSVKMEFIDNYRRDNKWKPLSLKVEQLREMGRFELGSTIIMATPEKLGKPAANITGNPIRTGDILFKQS
ncbi:MAG: archaetidylserine decarboxylase [Acidobacteriota bacterium]